MKISNKLTETEKYYEIHFGKYWRDIESGLKTKSGFIKPNLPKPRKYHSIILNTSRDKAKHIFKLAGGKITKIERIDKSLKIYYHCPEESSKFDMNISLYEYQDCTDNFKSKLEAAIKKINIGK